MISGGGISESEISAAPPSAAAVTPPTPKPGPAAAFPGRGDLRMGRFDFDNLANLGARMTLSTGGEPSVCQLSSVPLDRLDRTRGPLELRYANTLIRFPNARLLENSVRLQNTRRGNRYSIQIADRRVDWRYTRIDGVYNERAPNGTIQASGKKSARDLVRLIMLALGETSYDISQVPNDVYPPVFWDRAYAARELDWLCDLLGMVVCLQTNDAVHIRPLNNTAGQELPARGHLIFGQDKHSWKSAAIPSSLRVQGGPTEVQSTLTLEAVGLETDGSIESIDDLSYLPAAGWGDPLFFGDVAAASRHLAIASVFRWFRPSAGWDGDGVDVNDGSQIELLTRLVEAELDADGYYRPLDPVVKGVFWREGEHGTASAATDIYSGEFRVLPELGILEFARPVVGSGSFDLVQNEPTLTVTIGYRIRKPQLDGYSVWTEDKTVTQAPAATSPRVLDHPELTKKKIVDAIYGTTGDNVADILAEAQVYNNALANTYAYDKSQDVLYDGFLDISPDGGIMQVEWHSDEHHGATTRVGRFNEFDLKSAHASQRRALRRLAQMAQKQGV